MRIAFNPEELAELDRQDPETKDRGGWQGLLVSLQRRVNRSTLELILDDRDLERIARYAFHYKNGGWQRRLLRIFGRTLGPTLGTRRLAA